MNDFNLAVTISVLATFYVSSVYLLLRYLSVVQDNTQANQAD
jgi:hypothetical protein